MSQPVELTGLRRLSVLRPGERANLERRARLLAWGGIAWHVVEFGIAVAAGTAAGSIALIGFGANSLIEALAGFVVVRLFTGRRIGQKLHSAAAVKQASQTQLCAYLSVALLVGLLANALLGAWWADPAAALVIAAVAVREGRQSWRGEGCCCDAC